VPDLWPRSFCVAIKFSHGIGKAFVKIRRMIPLFIAIAATIPGVCAHVFGVQVSPPLTALMAGVAILGASFMLLWACDAAQADVSQTLALAVVALVAVLPEYAVDMYFTWQAGKDPTGPYAHYAVANMTGANRLIIGVAWGVIVAVFWLKWRRQVIRLEAERKMELFFLALATIYAFLIPIKGTLAWYDAVAFLGIYALYVVAAARRPAEPEPVEGFAELLMNLPKVQRRTAVGALFLVAAGVILANAEAFSEGLVQTGKLWNINEFLLVQWLAPIASEAPEFTVAIIFAWRGQASASLGSLLSSRLNQWTLLVGMIPIVFAISHGTLEHPMPMDHFQMNEIFLTAAQSLLAIVMLAWMRLSLGGALLLFILFAGQLVMPPIVERYPGIGMGIGAEHIHPLFSSFYIVAALALFLMRPTTLWELRNGYRAPKLKS
jgi:cation:H+ antiporter